MASNPSIESIVTTDSSSILNNAKQMWKKLAAECDHAADASVQKVEEILEEIRRTAASSLHRSQTELENKFTSINQQISQLKEKANKNNVNISECLGANENNLDQLHQKCIKELSLLMNDKLSTIEEVSKTATNRVRDFLNEVTSLKSDIDKCQYGFSINIQKVSEIISKIGEYASSLPSRISSDSSQTLTIIEDMKADLEACCEYMAQKSMRAADEIFDTISNCASRKLEK